MSTFASNKEEDNDYIEVFFNDCYGGFGISKEALVLYNKKLLERNPGGIIKKDRLFFDRTDPILLEVYYEMNGENHEKGKGFNDKYTQVAIEKIPKIYKNCYYIDEYDGMETVNIDYKKFEVDEIRKIANDEKLTFEERIKKIQEFKIEIY